MTSKQLPCGLREADRLDYADHALNGARGEYVDAHVRHCPDCQTWLADFDALGRMLQEGLAAPEEPWRWAAFTERLVEAMRKDARPRRLRYVLGALGGIALVLLLTMLPLSTQGGQFLDGAVEFGKMQVKQAIPEDQQRNLLDTLDFAQHRGATPQVTPVAPRSLPASLKLTKHSITENGSVQLLYGDGEWTTLLVWENAPRPGSLRTVFTAKTHVVTVDGTQVLVLADPRPGAVAALSWVHDGVFFNVLMLAAPQGNEGGFQEDAALDIVQALNAAQ